MNWSIEERVRHFHRHNINICPGWRTTMSEQARNMHPLHFQTLLSELESHGQGKFGLVMKNHRKSLDSWLASIPLSVKQEMIALIKKYLEKQFEPWLHTLFLTWWYLMPLRACLESTELSAIAYHKLPSFATTSWFCDKCRQAYASIMDNKTAK